MVESGTMVRTGVGGADSGTMVQSGPLGGEGRQQPEPSFMRYMRQGQGSGQLDVQNIAADLADVNLEISNEDEVKINRRKQLQDRRQELQDQYERDKQELELKYAAKFKEYDGELARLQ